MSDYRYDLIRSITEAEHDGDYEAAAELIDEFRAEAAEEPDAWWEQLTQARREFRDCGVTLADAELVQVRVEIGPETFEDIFEGVGAAVRWAVEILAHGIPNEDPLPMEYWGRDGVAVSVSELVDWNHDLAFNRFLRGKDLSEPWARASERLAFAQYERRPRTARDRRRGDTSFRSGGGPGTVRVLCELTWA